MVSSVQETVLLRQVGAVRQQQVHGARLDTVQRDAQGGHAQQDRGYQQ